MPDCKPAMPVGPQDEDWQLVSAASGSSTPSNTPDPHSAQQQRTQHSQQHPSSRSASPAKGQHQSPGLQTSSMQDFPELEGISNAELAGLLVDETKYRKLVASIMAKSSVAQVCCSSAAQMLQPGIPPLAA